MANKFDMLVVGAGHAGCEAACAGARLGARVCLVTLRMDGIAKMSCNPAIGGIAKGHLVREIDALGGVMAQIADATGIQFRRLNASRGPAVRSTRAQSDSLQYQRAMTEQLLQDSNITLVEDEVTDLLVQAGRIVGGTTRVHGDIPVPCVVVTTGTFLNGLCHVGDESFHAGRVGDDSVHALADSLKSFGIQMERFKTGTTPRLAKDSIQWNKLEAQHGDVPTPRFSFDPIENQNPQVPCFLTATNEVTRDVIISALDRSPLFSGVIQGRGPRYCPSIEDKMVRFADKKRHQVFLEPEGLESDRIYPNGLATSLPKDVQMDFLHSIVGLEHAEVLQFGYAVEYDFAPPTQLNSGLMTKKIEGLFLAGQINGTSGYEEAAAQGLMAGLNVVRYLGAQSEAVLGRSQAYIGVLIDDLVTKGVDEPYRMFTSRAEHRLTLRESNAEERLWPVGERFGLLPSHRIRTAKKRQQERDDLRKHLADTLVGEDVARSLGLDPSSIASLSRAGLLRRPEIHIQNLLVDQKPYDAEAQTIVEEEIKYAGYIQREQREIAKLLELESVRFPSHLDLNCVSGLSREIQEKLHHIRPKTLGQASRIPGMTPAALALLRVHAHRSGIG